MYIARDNRAAARFAVVVRGTDWNFLADWKNDFDVIDVHDWPTANPPNPSIEVAEGSWKGLETLLAVTSDVFNMPPPSIALPTPMAPFFLAEAVGSTVGTDLDIYVTGHSLGGALATVVGLWLADTAAKWVLRPDKVNFKTYTFASPTVGNQDFVSYYNGQTANAQVQWQAFRVYNEQDAIPFAYANLIGIPTDGVPYSFLFGVELALVLAGIATALAQAGVSYVQVGTRAAGTAVGLNNDPPSAKWAPPCSSKVDHWTDLSCWVGYEHDHNTYLFLLGAPTLDIPQRAVDTASVAATPLQPFAQAAIAAGKAGTGT